MTVIQSGQDRFAGHTIFGAFLTLSTDVTALITIISELRLNPFFLLEKSGLQPAHPCSNARNIHLSPERVKLFLTESYEKEEKESGRGFRSSRAFIQTTYENNQDNIE